MQVYDLRSGHEQGLLSAPFDPCFVRFFPGCADRILAASQSGCFQTIQWGNHVTPSHQDLGHLWPTFDRVVAMDISNEYVQLSRSSCRFCALPYNVYLLPDIDHKLPLKDVFDFLEEAFARLLEFGRIHHGQLDQFPAASIATMA